MADNYNNWLKSFTIEQKATMMNRISEGKSFHGVSKTKEYRTLISMKTRCYNKNFKRYKDYGGRGIKVCDRWLDKLTGYENFVADMGRCPPNMNSIDRIDNNGDYCKENCRWANHKDQNNNARTNIKVEYEGVIYRSRAELCQKFGIKRSIFYRRKKSGQTMEEFIKEAISATNLTTSKRKTDSDNCKL